MKRALTRYTIHKQKTLRVADTTGQRKEVTQKETQLHRVQLEKQRTSHMLPGEARRRLEHEIGEFEELIKVLRAAIRRSSNPDRCFSTLNRSFKRRSSIAKCLSRARGSSSERAGATSSRAVAPSPWFIPPHST